MHFQNKNSGSLKKKSELFQKTVTWKEFLGLPDCCSVCPKCWHRLWALSVLPTLQTWATYFGLWLSWVPDLFVKTILLCTEQRLWGSILVLELMLAGTRCHVSGRLWGHGTAWQIWSCWQALAACSGLPAALEQRLSLPVSVFTEVLQGLSIISSVTGGCVSLSRRTFVPWWKGSGLPWGTGLGAASCLQLQPILPMW